jgi:hypothetical protein
MPQSPFKPDSGNPESGLRHQLTAGQMTMVAVGGSIGTGLLLGTAAAIELAGPAVILSFVLAAFISWTVALALGELASTHPAAGSFGVYGDLYLNHWAGFISRAGYWLAIAVSIGAEMVASATYMQLWFPRVPAVVWVFAFSAFLFSINFLCRPQLRTFRILVRHDQGRGHRHLYRSRRRPAPHRTTQLLNTQTTADSSRSAPLLRFSPSPSPSTPSAASNS